MNDELSYILLTPYTIAKSRTGGVLARLLSRLDLELAAAQMLTFTREMTEEYALSILNNTPADHRDSAKLLHDFILKDFSPSEGRRHRVLLLIFRGKNAVQKLRDITGALFPENLGIESLKGETIRDTYADLVYSREDATKIEYFEPAVLTPHSLELALINLKLFAQFSTNEPNIVENMKYKDPSKIERTLVIIKPDNWRFPSSRPGTIIDMFSRTGLRIIATKVYQMSVSEALEFYGPVQAVLREKLSPIAGKIAATALEEKLQITISEQDKDSLSQSVGMSYADDQFFKIIEFMSGTRPDTCPEDKLQEPGKVKSMVLLYEGENAVQKIRDVLGPTDPTKAPGGTVRREFGSDVMVNTAHASDSAENAKREMEVVKIQHNNLAVIIEEYLKTR